VSRSGITICAGLILGYKREDSARFSFLLGTPVIFGAFLLHLIKSYDSINTDEIGLYVTGVVTSATVGFLAIRFLMRFLANKRLDIFAYYRIALAIVIIVLCV